MPTPLTTAAELASVIEDPSLRVVDCRWYLDDVARAPNEYRSGHIPRAVFASLDDDLTAPSGPGRHPLPSPEQFARTVERLGITLDTAVVVYDDVGGSFAARLWWMLTDQGHEHTSVLDGGIQAWVAHGGALSTSPVRPAAGGMPTGPWRRAVDRDAVAARAEGVVVVDARAGERYRGEVEPLDPVAGHIPGAVSLPQLDNLTDSLTLRSSADLRRRFESVGATDPERVIVYCGSGVTSCHIILAMEVAGVGRALLYPGSWSDWSTSGLPVATGTEPRPRGTRRRWRSLSRRPSGR